MMFYARLIAVLLVMFGLVACGGTDGGDVKKADNDDDVPVFNTGDDTDDTGTDEGDSDGPSGFLGDRSGGTEDEGGGSDGGDDGSGDDDGPAQVCGNGTLDPDEACDDGNTSSRDGCSDICEIETVVLRNLEVSLADTFNCVDDRCTAEYAMTMTLQNFTDQWVDRVTNIRIGMGSQVISTGGIQCNASQWVVGPESRSQIIDIELQYDRYDWQWRYSLFCDSESSASRFYGDYDESSYHVESGEVSFEITGLLEDGAVWSTRATTDLRDLR